MPPLREAYRHAPPSTERESGIALRCLLSSMYTGGGRYYQKANGGVEVREIQKHLSILQAALKMGCCPQTAKRIFKDLPGVGKYPGKNGRIYYRIPMDVFIRVDHEYRGLVECAAE